MFTIYATDRIKRAAMAIPSAMKHPRTVGQKLSKHDGLSLANIIKLWGGEDYMKPNGALTPLGRDEFSKMKSSVGLPKNASTEEYLARVKERFSYFVSGMRRNQVDVSKFATMG